MPGALSSREPPFRAGGARLTCRCPAPPLSHRFDSDSGPATPHTVVRSPPRTGIPPSWTSNLITASISSTQMCRPNHGPFCQAAGRRAHQERRDDEERTRRVETRILRLRVFAPRRRPASERVGAREHGAVIRSPAPDFRSAPSVCSSPGPTRSAGKGSKTCPRAVLTWLQEIDESPGASAPGRHRHSLSTPGSTRRSSGRVSVSRPSAWRTRRPHHPVRSGSRSG